MGKRFAILSGVLALALAITAVATAKNGGRPLSTTLTGAAEAPGPGDPDATGEDQHP